MYTSQGLKDVCEKLNNPHLKKFTLTDICLLLKKSDNQFYKLYGDKKGFYLMLVRIALKNSLWQTNKDDAIDKVILNLLLTLQENRYFFTNIAKFIGKKNHDAVKNMIKEEFEQYFSYYISQSRQIASVEPKVKQAALKTYFILSTWLKGGCREKPAIIQTLFEDIFIYLNGKIA